MKPYFNIAIVLLIGIVGLQSAAANCVDEYIGDYHSLYRADVDHPCPNSYEYADYNLNGDLSGDFDLYVLDTWNSSWYKSATKNPNEYLRVPIHCDFPHNVYVWAYKGSGNWTVCSPQVYFDEGFTRLADTDSSPDTETIESGIVGRWQLTFDWGCDGEPNEAELGFYEDGTFANVDASDRWGEWTKDGEEIRWQYDETNTLYKGSIYGLYMSGSMSTDDGDEGCWTASKIEGEP